MAARRRHAALVARRPRASYPAANGPSTSAAFAAWVWTRDGLVPATPAAQPTVAPLPLRPSCAPGDAAPWHVAVVCGLSEKLRLKACLLAWRWAAALARSRRGFVSRVRCGAGRARAILCMAWTALAALLARRRWRVRASGEMFRSVWAARASSALKRLRARAARRQAARSSVGRAETWWRRLRLVAALGALRAQARDRRAGLLVALAGQRQRWALRSGPALGLAPPRPWRCARPRGLLPYRSTPGDGVLTARQAEALAWSRRRAAAAALRRLRVWAPVARLARRRIILARAFAQRRSLKAALGALNARGSVRRRVEAAARLGDAHARRWRLAAALVRLGRFAGRRRSTAASDARAQAYLCRVAHRAVRQWAAWALTDVPRGRLRKAVVAAAARAAALRRALVVKWWRGWVVGTVRRARIAAAIADLYHRRCLLRRALGRRSPWVARALGAARRGESDVRAAKADAHWRVTRLLRAVAALQHSAWRRSAVRLTLREHMGRAAAAWVVMRERTCRLGGVVAELPASAPPVALKAAPPAVAALEAVAAAAGVLARITQEDALATAAFDAAFVGPSRDSGTGCSAQADGSMGYGDAVPDPDCQVLPQVPGAEKRAAIGRQRVRRVAPLLLRDLAVMIASGGAAADAATAAAAAASAACSGDRSPRGSNSGRTGGGGNCKISECGMVPGVPLGAAEAGRRWRRAAHSGDQRARRIARATALVAAAMAARLARPGPEPVTDPGPEEVVAALAKRLSRRRDAQHDEMLGADDDLAWFGPLAEVSRLRRRCLRKWFRWARRRCVLRLCACGPVRGAARRWPWAVPARVTAKRRRRETSNEAWGAASLCRVRAVFTALALYAAAAQDARRWPASDPSEAALSAVDAAADAVPPRAAAEAASTVLVAPRSVRFQHCIAPAPPPCAPRSSPAFAALRDGILGKVQRACLREALRRLHSRALAAATARRAVLATADAHARRRALRVSLCVLRARASAGSRRRRVEAVADAFRTAMSPPLPRTEHLAPKQASTPRLSPRPTLPPTMRSSTETQRRVHMATPEVELSPADCSLGASPRRLRAALVRFRRHALSRQWTREATAQAAAFRMGRSVWGDSATPEAATASPQTDACDEQSASNGAPRASASRRAWSLRRPVALDCFRRWSAWVAGRRTLLCVFAGCLDSWTTAMDPDATHALYRGISR